MRIFSLIFVVHHLKSKTALHNILDVVKSNEIEEFGVTFPERREEIFTLKEKYDDLRSKLEEGWEKLKDKRPKNTTKKENKKYAMAVFNICDDLNIKQFTGLFFGLKDGKVNSIKDYLMEYDNRKLYKFLN